MNRRWVCNDVWMDIFPHLDHAQLGLKMALLSPRFNALVDKHFDGKSELPLLRQIRIAKKGTKLSVATKSNPLPIKIRFINLRIEYIGHSVIEFLRSNRQIFEKGTHMDLYLDLDNLHYDNKGIVQPIWNFFAGEIWPIRHLIGHHLGDLRCHISPTIFTDCNQLNSIVSDNLLPAAIADDGPNATARQALTKWLNTPTKNGQPKQLICCGSASETNECVVNFKKEFLRANSSASYIIQFKTYTSIAQFELVNGRTKEKLTLKAEDDDDHVYTHINCVLERCQIGRTIQWEDKKTDKLNNVIISLYGNCIGPLSPQRRANEGKRSSENECRAQRTAEEQ